MISHIGKKIMISAVLAAAIAGISGCGKNAQNQSNAANNQNPPAQSPNTVVYTPEPAPAPPPAQVYTYYYYDPNQQVYYACTPGGAWVYYPGTPPAGVVYWSGPPPVLPVAPPNVVVAVPPVSVSLGFDFYFDPVARVYYYHDPHYGWRYYPGHPPPSVHIWSGPAPHDLPRPR